MTSSYQKYDSKNNYKVILLCIGVNAFVIIVYFLIWMLFHYLWMRQKVTHPEYLYLTLPIILVLLNSKFIDDDKKPVKYLKAFLATALSCVIWIWLIWFLGVVFHWRLGGKL